MYKIKNFINNQFNTTYIVRCRCAVLKQRLNIMLKLLHTRGMIDDRKNLHLQNILNLLDWSSFYKKMYKWLPSFFFLFLVILWSIHVMTIHFYSEIYSCPEKMEIGLTRTVSNALFRSKFAPVLIARIVRVKYFYSIITTYNLEILQIKLEKF